MQNKDKDLEQVIKVLKNHTPQEVVVKSKTGRPNTTEKEREIRKKYRKLYGD
jgi:hypothetical protein